ncbi:hypothetical protein ACFQZ2_13940, partial [Streptomonospora algeriensis]
MATRSNWIERKARQAVGGRLDGMRGGSPAFRTHRPDLKGGAAQVRGLGGIVQRALRNRGTSPRPGAGKRHGGGMQRGIRRVE